MHFLFYFYYFHIYHLSKDDAAKEIPTHLTSDHDSLANPYSKGFPASLSRKNKII